MGSDTYTVVRTATIDAPASELYERVVDLHRWESWSPWADLDPDMDLTYSGADAGVGAVYEWSGNSKAGAGRMEIVEVVPDERVTLDLAFLKPFKSEWQISMTFAPVADEQTQVTWTLTGHKTLASRIMGIFVSMDKMVGKDFEKGLERLRSDVGG